MLMLPPLFAQPSRQIVRGDRPEPHPAKRSMLEKHDFRNQQETTSESPGAASGPERSGPVDTEGSGTPEPPNGGAGLASHLFTTLLRAAHLLRTALNDHLADFGLNDVRYAVLVEIDRCGPDGCTQTELADRLRQSESNVCTLVERMRQDGWLYRHRAKSDRRKRILRPTERARQTLRRIRVCHEQRLQRILNGLGTAQQRQLGTLLGTLCDCLEERLGGAVASRPANSCEPGQMALSGGNAPWRRRANQPAVGRDGGGPSPTRLTTPVPQVPTAPKSE
ncbi:MAG TPA: MarR family transcriptional regulator [Planctomycetaceae bacterium]|nr:MarR family transcriptional regulator [Planctomycetaceae bacterium]